MRLLQLVDVTLNMIGILRQVQVPVEIRVHEVDVHALDEEVLLQFRQRLRDEHIAFQIEF